MFGNLIDSFILLSVAASAMADGYSRPIVMAGVTQMSDTAELHFDPALAEIRTLVILGHRTSPPRQSYSFVYSLPAAQRVEIDPAVNLDFAGTQKLAILSDPGSDDCMSSGVVTLGATTFPMLWKVTQR